MNDAPATVNLPPPPVAGTGVPGRWLAAMAVLLSVLSTAAVVYAWNTQQRVKLLEQDLVKRQQDSGGQAAEARLLAKQAQEVAHDSAGKLALLEARVAETSLQRTQLEDLIQSLSRSRDENLLADVDAAVRVALQHSAITGSTEPLLAALKQSDERLARANQPRLERVRRALAHDLERVKAASSTDISSLTIRLDEAVRLVDDLPLLALSDPRGSTGLRAPPKVAKPPAATGTADTWHQQAQAAAQLVWDRFWDEAKGLVRVTRIDQPDAALVAPEQAFFLRENVKLRLLNARLALMSRQFDVAQSDLRDAQAALEKYFDKSARRVASSVDLVRQVAAQARQISLPRPDETLAAIATASAGR